MLRVEETRLGAHRQLPLVSERVDVEDAHDGRLVEEGGAGPVGPGRGDELTNIGLHHGVLLLSLGWVDVSALLDRGVACAPDW